MMFIGWTAAFLGSYLLGSVPFSFLIAKAWGVDLRREGSRNIGATNVARTCGPVAGTLAYVLDIAKGGVAVAWCAHVASSCGAQGLPQVGFLAACFAAPLGHLYPVWLGFRGGKGVATSAGVLWMLFPVPLSFCLALFLVVFLSFRIISIASMAAALVAPGALYLFHVLNARRALGGLWAHETLWQRDQFRWLFGLTALLCAFVIYKHRSNIGRLLRGEEHAFRKK